ncbi:serine/threonine protein phosphatase [Massilia eurypsychrophila]|jgi:serine/threonine protein phosphatase PrpC|uniref:Serine/threonine protein phosphatase n=1 Tax=Massilia eurypsychrophila TaxID=1485217 RepID=A0A2G8T8Z0_9BURK|nr:PP2C family serine/threonine-protein phosphatase [Massilia eurypsychrophila]PIL42520.1 serine/threonine protein phosphatase [Massilia eurypsychrophila]
MKPYKLEAGTAQHIGNRPQQNDRSAIFAGARAPGYVMAVLADGIAGGATASEQVLHTAKQLFDEFKPGDNPGIERLATLLRDIVHETHLVIKMNGVATETEPQCTFAGLIITPGGQAVWAHVGDSRVYRFQQGECKARTSDASYIDHLMGTEKLPAESARNHRHSKLLVNVLGNSRKEPFVSIGSQEELGIGDAFLLCSDGLWHFFTDAELGAVLSKSAPRQASELLIDKATERAQGKGGNCTMAIIKLVKPPKDVPNYTVQKMGRAV